MGISFKSLLLIATMLEVLNARSRDFLDRGLASYDFLDCFQNRRPVFEDGERNFLSDAVGDEIFKASVDGSLAMVAHSYHVPSLRTANLSLLLQRDLKLHLLHRT